MRERLFGDHAGHGGAQRTGFSQGSANSTCLLGTRDPLVTFLQSHIQGDILGRVGFWGHLLALRLSTMVRSSWALG